jgi:hypothetical protein
MIRVTITAAAFEAIAATPAEAWRGDGVGIDRLFFEHGLALIAARRSPSQFPPTSDWSTWFLLKKGLDEKLAALRRSGV